MLPEGTLAIRGIDEFYFLTFVKLHLELVQCCELVSTFLFYESYV